MSIISVWWEKAVGKTAVRNFNMEFFRNRTFECNN